MAKPQRWSDEWVRGLEHPTQGAAEKVFHDQTLSGHRLVVKRTRKTFEVQAKRPKRFGPARTFVVQIGDALDCSIEEARSRAMVALGRIRRGEDPRGLSPAAAARTDAGQTLGAAWQVYRKREDLGPRTLAMYESTWTRNLEKWKDEPMRTLALTPLKAHDEHKAIAKRAGPSEADHAMRLLRSIYRHAARFNVELPGDRNPCSAVEWHGDKTRTGAAIPATMMPEWHVQLEKLRAASPIRASFHMLCLRLGTRPGELARASWSDVDYERNVLVLPETKTTLTEIPLTAHCIAEFRHLEAFRGLNFNDRDGRMRDFVFPSRAGKRDIGHLTHHLEKKKTLSHSGNTGRHTHHTLGVRLGIEDRILDVLEGRSLKKSEMAGRGYIDRHELAPEMRRAQQLINDEIDRLFLGKSG
jgi:integrase